MIERINDDTHSARLRWLRLVVIVVPILLVVLATTRVIRERGRAVDRHARRHRVELRATTVSNGIPHAPRGTPLELAIRVPLSTLEGVRYVVEIDSVGGVPILQRGAVAPSIDGTLVIAVDEGILDPGEYICTIREEVPTVAQNVEHRISFLVDPRR